MADGRLEDVFLIGGDATPPQGPYPSAVDLLPVICDHAHRPREIGIAGYPEGHPLVDPARLEEALDRKSAHADYITTQLCFNAEAVLAWVRETRDRGVELPVLVGVPGVVDRRRLLEISMRIGVGPSIAFLRKQRGLRRLLRPARVTPDEIYDALAPCSTIAR
jgi:methylenetetrahydrofolate reductase (NADPH)